jgi:hypothetical protein
MPFDGIDYEKRLDSLAKMDRVIALLSTEGRWCKQQLRSYDGRRCLLGAMMAADATIALREPILTAIRQVTGTDHLRIELFNDHPATSHKLLLDVLAQARGNIMTGAVDTAPPAQARLGLWSLSFRPLERLRSIFG